LPFAVHDAPEEDDSATSTDQALDMMAKSAGSDDDLSAA
jgi:hypothetical protein